MAESRVRDVNADIIAGLEARRGSYLRLGRSTEKVDAKLAKLRGTAPEPDQAEAPLAEATPVEPVVAPVVQNDPPEVPEPLPPVVETPAAPTPEENQGGDQVGEGASGGSEAGRPAAAERNAPHPGAGRQQRRGPGQARGR